MLRNRDLHDRTISTRILRNIPETPADWTGPDGVLLGLEEERKRREERREVRTNYDDDVVYFDMVYFKISKASY